MFEGYKHHSYLLGTIQLNLYIAISQIFIICKYYLDMFLV